MSVSDMPMTKLSNRSPRKNLKATTGNSSILPLRYFVAFLCMLLSIAIILYSLSYDLCLFVHRDGLMTTPSTEETDAAPTLTVDPNEAHFQKDQGSKQNSTHATVMGMGYGYSDYTFKYFVGTLRRAGYQGNIIIGVEEHPRQDVMDYLNSQNVTMKHLRFVECKVDIENLRQREKDGEKLDSHQKEVMKCAHPHTDLKIRWGRFALMKDWLEECKDCTGPVLVADVRDTYFQRDPFGPEAPPVTGLEVYEEHRRQRTTHWLVQFPVEKCKKRKIFDEVMLCSGTTIGTREAMLRYLGDMATEMREWMKDENCCCNGMNGDDQAVHNWLFYSGGLPYGRAVPNRMGLVNTVGVQGSIIGENKRKKLSKQLNIGEGSADGLPYTTKEEEAKGKWLGDEYDQTDEQGYFLDFNGERSFVIHQWDRYGHPFDRWIRDHGPMKGLY